MLYITFDLEGDLLALLLLVYTQMETDIQESSTNILMWETEEAFDAHFKGLL